MVRSFFAFIAAAALSALVYFASGNVYIFIGAFFAMLHINFFVLIVTLPDCPYLKKFTRGYLGGVYCLLFGGFGIVIWAFTSLAVFVAAPLYYVIAGRKYEKSTKKKRKKNNDKSEVSDSRDRKGGAGLGKSGGKSDGIIPLSSVPFVSGSAATVDPFDAYPDRADVGRKSGETYSVYLQEAGARRNAVIRELCDLVTGDMKSAEKLVDSAPCRIISDISLSDANDLASELNSCGAKTRVVSE